MPLGDKKKDIKYVKMKSRLKVILGCIMKVTFKMIRMENPLKI